ncbi:DUF6941 family protein [Rugamonas aquatica]|uniref:Uncharacterized protein n=1 Tax=Rugamonas aquatica TaxID=2743357 RepID=A0A6A7N4Y4_9BURK|nr:hypothetical protein [Rugamonas aquatica]MQA39951.1 hypothetical protein [Rugamonas aquatica]
MISSIFTVVANRAIVDARSQNLSLIDIFEGFKSISFPVVIPSVAVVFYLQRAEGDANIQEGIIKYEIDNSVVFSTPVQIDFQENLTTRLIFEVEGFLIPSIGQLKINLSINDSVVAEYQAPVMQLEIPAPALAAAPTRDPSI